MFNWKPFGTGKHNFGHIPDPPEPEEEECHGNCDSCIWFEERKNKLSRCNDTNGEGYKEKEDEKN